MTLPLTAAVAAGTTLIGAAILIGGALFIHSNARAAKARAQSDQLRQDLQRQAERHAQARAHEEARAQAMGQEALELRLFLLKQQLAHAQVR